MGISYIITSFAVRFYPVGRCLLKDLQGFCLDQVSALKAWGALSS